jgi:hypothetical protein
MFNNFFLTAAAAIYLILRPFYLLGASVGALCLNFNFFSWLYATTFHRIFCCNGFFVPLEDELGCVR